MEGKELPSVYGQAERAESASERPPVRESRFPDKEAIEDYLEESPEEAIELLKGSLDEAYPELIPEHVNRVELARLLGLEQGTSAAIPLTIHAGSQDIMAIFKPVDGEKPELGKTYGRTALAPYEEMAYRVSEHFGLDLVPPTVYRSVHGRPGSLQLFMSPLGYGAGGYVYPEDDYEARLRAVPDYQAMGVLDFLILNPDRHRNNFLVRSELHGTRRDPEFDLLEPDYQPLGERPELVAIDHGLAFSPAIFTQYNIEQSRMGGFQGPMRSYTGTTRRTGPYEVRVSARQPEAVPDWLLARLQAGLADREPLEYHLRMVAEKALKRGDEQPSNQVEQVLDQLWQRTDALLASGTYLSSLTTHELPSTGTYEARVQHPPLRFRP